MNIRNVVSELTTHPTLHYGKRSLYEIDQIIIHHSAGHMSVEQTAKFHVEDRGWPGIGYHFMILPGNSVQMTNALDTISYHCRGENTRSIGICVKGNFEEDEPTATQVLNLYELVELLKSVVKPDLKVYGHRDKGNTLCPGKHLYSLVTLLNG